MKEKPYIEFVYNMPRDAWHKRFTMRSHKHQMIVFETFITPLLLLEENIKNAIDDDLVKNRALRKIKRLEKQLVFEFVITDYALKHGYKEEL